MWKDHLDRSEWLQIAWNCKSRGQQVIGRPRRHQNETSEVFTGITLPNSYDKKTGEKLF
jgi:hypothetical protein